MKVEDFLELHKISNTISKLKPYTMSYYVRDKLFDNSDIDMFGISYQDQVTLMSKSVDAVTEIFSLYVETLRNKDI